jgi:class 3 adenylate cyclase/RecA/RadA recombinase
VTATGRGDTLRPYVSRLGRTWPGTAAHQAIDGALVSLDLRGFTNLTRRFPARGRAGAEEVTTVISTCFARLVDEVEARGGDVVAFGGDALLALFDGPDAGSRAATAAIALRDAVGALGAVPTSLGAIRLSARVAIAPGRIDCYRIGTRQRAVVVAGPVVSRTLALERLAKAREIVADGVLFEQAANCRRGAARGDGFLLAGARDLAISARRERSRSDGVAAFVAPALRPWLRAGVDAGEHRDLTVAFVALGGLDRVRARRGPSGVLDTLEGFAAALEASCERHQLSWVNTDAQRDGVKVTLVAGLPAAGDRDDARLVRGVQQLMAARPEFSVTAGAAACRAYVGDIGNASRRGLMVMGDGVNLAARLASRARPHQLLADPSLASRLPDLRRVASTPFRARGFPEPVRPYRIEDAADASGTSTANDPTIAIAPGTLHGRGRERDVLLRALEAARNGVGSVVEIVGEPGAGKSRLAVELLASCGALEPVVVIGDPTSARTPFGSLRNGLRRRVGPARARRHDLAPLFRPPNADAPPMTEQAQRRLHEALIDALDDNTALVLVVDDAQWLDDASRALLTAIAAASNDRGWLLCITRRTGSEPLAAPPAVRVHRLRLRALSGAAVRAIAREATPAPVPSAQLDRIVDASGGNPLFASQLAAASPELNDTLPERIERVIAARIDALAPRDRARLRDAAVMGRTAPLDLVVTVTGDTTLARHSAWTSLAGLVELDGHVIHFEHELVRRVAYDGLSFARRRALHAACADALIAQARRAPASIGDLAGAIAWHAEGASQPERCWEWGRRRRRIRRRPRAIRARAAISACAARRECRRRRNNPRRTRRRG